MALPASVIPAGAQPGYITTVAGGGTGGDGGPAVTALLAQPSSVAVDAAGNFYIADTDAQRIRKVTAATGLISTVAGTGVAGSGGDGGPATAATLNSPVGVAVDGAGNLYVAEYFGHRIRKVNSATGAISTYAGNGTAAFGGDGGTATAASLNSPWGVSVDVAGNLYIADFGNNRIRKVAAASGVISTIAGSSSGFSGDGGLATAATLANPLDVCVGGDGNFYIADYGNNRIRKIVASTGVISTVAGDGAAAFGGDGGQATAAQINQPYGVAADQSGNIFVADTDNHRIRYVAAATGIISTIAGTGSATFDGDGGLAVNASFELPLDVAIAGTSDLGIADYGNARIRRLTGRELPVITWATPSSIIYGTALSAAQLNATAIVTGTFVYNPAAGTVLNAGAQTLSVAFTPTDTVT
jgi:sugar lactone lactonase YvrE